MASGPAISKIVRRLTFGLGVFCALLVLSGFVAAIVDPAEGNPLVILVLGGPLAVLLLALGSKRVISKIRPWHRRRLRPPLPEGTVVVGEDGAFDPEAVPLPLFERALARLRTTVVLVTEGGLTVRLFRLEHADLVGEGSEWVVPGDSGRVVVTCAVAEVDAAMPLVVIRQRWARPITWSKDLREHTTELERFNRSFRLLAADPYAATAIVDPRMMDALGSLDRRYTVEIGGRWILVAAPVLDRAATRNLIAQTVRIARVFPRVANSLYPTEALRSDLS